MCVDLDKLQFFAESVVTAAGTYTYTYDALGNITSVNDGTYTTSYVYDSLNQLIRENDERAGKTYTYAYTNGNITDKKTYYYTTGELGSEIGYKTWEYENSTWGDLLTNYDGTEITYDEIGNPVTYGEGSLEWQGRQLQSITEDGVTAGYEYNGEGQRVSKTFDGVTTEFYYNGSILAGQKTGEDTIIFEYDNNGDPFAFLYNGTEYYYVKNAQNDVTAIANAMGTVLANYYYDAWGNILTISGDTALADANPIRYRSYYCDTETGWYYLNSRYYAPEMCRFLNADSWDLVVCSPTEMTDKNLFSYCDNNPVVRVDDEGNFWNFVIGAVVGAAVSAASAAVSGGDAKSIALSAVTGAVGGVIGASGLGVIGQVVANTLLSGASNLANQTLVEGKSLKNVDWVDVSIDAGIGGVSAAISSGITYKAGKNADESIKKSINKIVRGKNTYETTGRYGKGAIKRGLRDFRGALKTRNTLRGKSSVIGSSLGGFITSVKNFFRRR